MFSRYLVVLSLVSLSLYSSGQVYVEIKDGKAYIVDSPNAKKKAIVKFTSKEGVISTAQEMRVIAERKNIEIRTWDYDKIKVIAGVRLSDSGAITDDKLWEKAGIVISKTNEAVTITCKQATIIANQRLYFSSGRDSLAIREKNDALQHLGANHKNNTVDDPGAIKNLNDRLSVASSRAAGNNLAFDPSELNRSINNPEQYSNMSSQPDIIIYLPRNKAAKINLSYGSLKVSSPLSALYLSLANSSVYSDRIDTLSLESNHSQSDFGNIGSASFQIINSIVNAKSCRFVSITSSYSRFDADSIRHLTIEKSLDDVFEVDKIHTLLGKKEFGALKINRLFGKLDLTGIGADVRIRKMDPLCTSINIDNKLTHIGVALQTEDSYTLTFSGKYSTVLGLPDLKGNGTPESGISEADENKTFTKTNGGTSTGVHTIIHIKCDNCQADFR